MYRWVVRFLLGLVISISAASRGEEPAPQRDLAIVEQSLRGDIETLLDAAGVEGISVENVAVKNGIYWVSIGRASITPCVAKARLARVLDDELQRAGGKLKGVEHPWSNQPEPDHFKIGFAPPD